ncbi:serine hydrolase domain-containing protein [Mesorhizobium sp. IMUNJ 23232]|uniref:serine hydrolase domain-containing protein n=1 Tax=Mesorhizobium sp. IMUNJ 23232 TaxID=3376064 RepID=UPI0037AD1607
MRNDLGTSVGHKEKLMAMPPVIGGNMKAQVLRNLFLLAGLAAGLTIATDGVAAPTCPKDQIVTSDGCVSVRQASNKVTAIVRDAMPGLKLKAVVAGFAVDGSPPFLLAEGVSMTGVPAAPDMKFRNGAIAIAYMGTVLLQLRDEGAITLDDQLSRWFPEHPNADQVTLRMLINGTSGYADYVTDDGFLRDLHADPFRHWRPEELVEIGLKRPVVCEPGACWSYAHTNFVILGAVMEKATGQSLRDLIRARIIEPLGLTGTQSTQTAAIPEPVLHAFDAERGRYEESTFWNPSWTLADGAVMTTTIRDVLRSAEAIGGGTLLTPKSHAEQIAPLIAGFKPWSETSYYGLGVFLINGWILQNPSFSGYAATMGYLPEGKISLAVSVTMDATASMEGNLSTDVFKEIASYLAPDAPL